MGRELKGGFKSGRQSSQGAWKTGCGARSDGYKTVGGLLEADRSGLDGANVIHGCPLDSR